MGEDKPLGNLVRPLSWSAELARSVRRAVAGGWVAGAWVVGSGVVASRVISGLALTFLLAGAAVGQELDPLFGYVLSTDEGSWRMGGDLSGIRPARLDLPGDGEAGHRWGLSLSGIYSGYFRKSALETTDGMSRRRFNGSAFVNGGGTIDWDARAQTGERCWQIGLVEEQYDLEVDAAYAGWATSVEARMAREPVVLSLGLQTSPDNPCEPAIAAGADLRRYGTVGAVWTRRYLSPRVDFYWHEEQGHVLLNGLLDESSAWMRSPQIGPFRAELLLGYNEWFPASKKGLETTVDPKGYEGTYHGFLAMGSEPWRWIVGTRGRDLDIEARGMKGDFDYAKVTACRLVTRGLFAALDHRSSEAGRRLLAEVEHLEWSGLGRGHLEFWPFTSGLIDLLGLRRRFEAHTEGVIWRLHLAGAGSLGKRWAYAAGLNLVDIRPSADLDHWRPAWVVVGHKEDEHIHRLSIRHIVAGVVSLSMTYRVSYWQAEYSLSQAVPLRIKRHPQADAQVPPDDPAETESRSSGGGFHRLSLRWCF